MFNSYYYLLKHIFDKLPIFDRYCFQFIMWDLIYTSIIILNLILIPFYVSFNSSDIYLLKVLSIIIIIINFLIDLNSTCYENGELIDDRQRIFSLVMRTDFASEFLGFICVLV
jgi:hypothetical protein